jgi:hypothetical protein
MKIISTLLFIFLNTGYRQADPLIGTWKGESICQVKDSPCHDEIAAYHISKGKKPGTYHMILNKVVNGKEEDMGVSDFDWDAAKHTLNYNDSQRGGAWQFTLKDNKLEGTAVFKGVLYRVIHLTKAN